MADVNLASLNFKLILDDGEFNDEITRIKNEADALNKSLSEMLNVHGGGLISKEEHQSAMRRLREEFQEAQNQQKLKLQWSKETAKMANDEAIAAGKIAQQQEKANNEKKKGLVIDEQIAAATKKKEAAEINAAAATERKVKAERDAARAETQRQTATINQAAAEERRLTAMNNRIRSQQRLNAEMEREGSILRRNSRIWNDMKNVALAYFSFEGARRLVSNLVRVSAEFEKQRVSLHAILQDADGAERIFGQIKALAVQSPFQFKELVTYTKQLSAFSIPMEELYDTTKMLADVSAGLGVGMDRLVLAYGQIRSASFLRGQEVRQLTEAGIPILRELSEMFTELEGRYVSAGEVFEKISKRQVTFEMVAQVFKNMTSEGGKFYQMQEVLAQTLSGKISNLTDAYQIMFAEIGEKTSGVLNGTVDALRSIAENYEKVGRLIIELVAIYGTYRGMLVAVAAAEKMVAGARMGGEIINMGTAFARAAKEALSFSSVLGKIGGLVSKLNPYAAAAAAVIALGAAIYNLTKRTSEYKEMEQGVTSVIADYNKEVEVETGNLEYLFKQLRQTSTESERYKRVRSEIISQYGQYLTDIDRENLALGKQESVYRNLTNAIRQASMEKALSAGREKISEYMDGMSKGIFEDLQQSLERLGYDGTGAIAKELGRYIRGEIKGIFELSDEAAEAYGKMIGSTEWNKITTGAKNILYYANPYNLIFDPDGKSQRTHNMDELRDAYKEVLGVVEEETERLYDGVEVIYGVWPGSKEAEVVMQNWQTDLKAIADEASEAGQRLGITVDAMSDIIDISKEVDKALEESATRAARYRAAGQEELAAAEEDRAEYLSRMQSRLGGPLSSGVGGKAETEDIVSNVQAQITVYQKLKKAYTDLTEYVSDSDARNFLATIFPQEMAFANFDVEIRRLADSLLTMGEAGVKAAIGLEAALNDEKLTEYLKHLEEVRKATDRANAAMKKVESVSGLFGEGAEFDISKALKKYKERLNKIKDERQEAIDAVYDEASKTGIFGLGYLEKGAKIDQWAMQEEADALTELNEEVRRQAQEWVRSWDGIASIDISHMADLTTNELNKLMEALQKLSENPEQYFSDDLKLGFKDTENSLKVFIAAIQEYVAQLNSQAEEKKWDKIVKKIRLYHDALKISTKALKELSDTAGWSGISDLADHLDKAADAAITFVKNLAEGDPLGAAMTAISYVVEEMIHLAKAAMEYRNTLREIEVEMNALNHTAMLTSGVNSIFGTDTYRALKNAYNLLDLMEGKIGGLRDTLGSITAHVDKSKWWQFLLAPTAWYGWFQHFFGQESFSSLLDELGADLFDETGRVNVEVIELLQSKFDKLSASEKVALEQAIQDAKDFNAALDQIDDTMEQLVGSVADDFADAIIDQWKAAGDAALDYSDILDGLASNYAKMFVRNAIMTELFDDEFQKQITSLTLAGRATDVLAAFDQKAAQLENVMPTIISILEGLGQYFNEDEAKSSSNTLGGGIKSITEDTANLLASYINAIRADVAAIRQSVAAEGAMNLPTPTLAEYLTQIQANTYNNAVAAQAILENLQSMMTMSDGPALRVFM